MDGTSIYLCVHQIKQPVKCTRISDMRYIRACIYITVRQMEKARMLMICGNRCLEIKIKFYKSPQARSFSLVNQNLIEYSFFYNFFLLLLNNYNKNMASLYAINDSLYSIYILIFMVFVLQNHLKMKILKFLNINIIEFQK